MKKVLIAIMACWALVQAGAEELQWLTDLPKAQQKAKAENKLVILDFTGSDWCPWCIRLNKEVFSQAEFIAYAKQNLVPVEVDFPRKKPQSEQQKQANEKLEQRYQIEGYPTVVVLDSQGKKLGTLGYEPGGPKPFIAQLDKLRKRS